MTAKKTTDPKPSAGARDMNSRLNLMLWYIKQMGGIDNAKTAVEAVAELQMKLSPKQEVSE